MSRVVPDLTQFEWDAIDADVEVSLAYIHKSLRKIRSCIGQHRWSLADGEMDDLDMSVRILADAIAKAQGKPISVPYVAPPMEGV